MYIPRHFSVPQKESLQQLIDDHPLGILFTNGRSGMDANHIPFMLDRSAGDFGVLHSHVARNNSVWQDIVDGDEVLIVFRAAEAYVSPSWYPSKHEFHKQVPTWNYMVAHATGRVTIRDDQRYVRGMVAKLTKQHEALLPDPWKMTDAPQDFIAMMVNNIVGIEIEITNLVGKFKLSQNKEARDIENAGNELKARGENELGDAMLGCVASKLE